LIPLHKDQDAMIKNLEGKKMHPVKVEIRRHVGTMERLHMWRFCYKKRDDFEKKVKHLEGDVSVVH
jgi:hypothetical protein